MLYFENPEFFRLSRSLVPTVKPETFNELLGLVRETIGREPRNFYLTPKGALMTYSANYPVPPDVVVAEIDGPTRLADNRALDVRLFTEHSAEEAAVGIVAMVGVDWRPSTPISELPGSTNFAANILAGRGAIISGDYGKIDTHWLLSQEPEGGGPWVTNATDGRSITGYELDQLASDLSST